METFIGHLSEVAAPTEETPTTEIQVFKTGKFRKGGRSFEIGEKQFDEAIKNFATKVAGDPPLDYDHEFAYGGSSAAAGWFKDIFKRDGALWATVELTADAAEKVKQGVYRFFSPEFAGNYIDETGKKHGFAIVAGGLTNRPFLKNMQPITMDERIAAELDDELDERIENALEKFAAERGRDMGLLNKTTEGEATIETLTARVAELEPLADQVETLTTERDDLKEQLSAAKSGKSDAEAEVQALTERIETIETDRFTETLAATLTKHRSRGAIDATDETTSEWTEFAKDTSVEKLDKTLARIPDGSAVPLSELGSGLDRDNPVYDEASRLTALDERATKIAAEKSIPYGEAALIAEKEMAS